MPARAQRRRQDHDHALDHGPDAARARADVLWKGRDITGWAPHRVARLGIGFVPEDRRIFAELTVWENLDVARRVCRPARAVDDRARVRAVSQAGASSATGRAAFLSGGEQQMLTIARTLMGNPELLLLDEPSEGLAPLVVEQLLRAGRRAEAAGPDDPAGRAGRRVLALARRPGVRSGEGRGALLGARGPAAGRRRAAQQAARTVEEEPSCRS